MATGSIVRSPAWRSQPCLPSTPKSGAEKPREPGKGVGARPRHHPPAATAEQPQSSSNRAQLPMAGSSREQLGWPGAGSRDLLAARRSTSRSAGGFLPLLRR